MHRTPHCRRILAERHRVPAGCLRIALHDVEHPMVVDVMPGIHQLDMLDLVLDMPGAARLLLGALDSCRHPGFGGAFLVAAYISSSRNQCPAAGVPPIPNCAEVAVVVVIVELLSDPDKGSPGRRVGW